MPRDNDLKRLDHRQRCGMCGRLIQAGTLVKEIHSHERQSEIVCPACLMKNKGKVNAESIYRVPSEFIKKKKKW